MNDEDCTAISSNANIHLRSITDIFYDNGFQFPAEKENDDSNPDYLYDRNYEAAQVIKEAFN